MVIPSLVPHEGSEGFAVVGVLALCLGLGFSGVERRGLRLLEEVGADQRRALTRTTTDTVERVTPKPIMFAIAMPVSRAQAADLPERSMIMDEAAFSRLYRLTARPLRAYLLRSCGDLDSGQRPRCGRPTSDSSRRGSKAATTATAGTTSFGSRPICLTDHYRRTAARDPRRSQRRTPHAGHADEIHLRNDVGERDGRDRGPGPPDAVAGVCRGRVPPGDRRDHGVAAGERAFHAVSARAARLAEELRSRGLRPELEGS
jgi:hypothetical protein